MQAIYSASVQEHHTSLSMWAPVNWYIHKIYYISHYADMCLFVACKVCIWICLQFPLYIVIVFRLQLQSNICVSNAYLMTLFNSFTCPSVALSMTNNSRVPLDKSGHECFTKYSSIPTPLLYNFILHLVYFLQHELLVYLEFLLFVVS